MQLRYRGHEIRLTRSGGWSAELVEVDSGTVLPTRAVAAAEEEGTVCLERAARLIDLYIEGARQAAR